MNHGKITFKDCMDMFESLEKGMSDLERITMSAQNKKVMSFLKNDSGSKRQIIYVNGEFQDNYDTVSDVEIQHMRLHRSLSFGIFGEKILEDFEIFKEDGEYKIKINSAYNKKAYSLLEMNKY